MQLSFSKAVKSTAKLRLALLGPTGSGKTYTALALCDGRRVAVIDSEHGSASKYADRFSFDVLNLPDHDPRTYIDAIRAAEQAGYEVVIIDSITHAWNATKDLVDDVARRSKSGNSFTAWGDVTPIWQSLIKAIVGSKIHVVATMRSKIEWVIEEDQRGKKVPKKIGTKPENRDGVEYEFDVVVEIDQDHNAWATKTRCPEIDGKTWKNPSASDLGAALFGWLEDGVAPAQPAPAPSPIVARQTMKDTTAGRPAPPVPTTNAWTAEQKAEAKSISDEITASGDPEAITALAKVRADMKGAPAADIIDALVAIHRAMGN